MAKTKTEATPKQRGCGCLVVLVILAVVAGVVAISGSSGYSIPTSFTVSDSAVSHVVTGVINSEEDSPGINGQPTVNCVGDSSCTIGYTVKQPAGISAALELIDPTRQIWKALFEDSNFRSGTITVSGPATSVGGKTTNSPLFTLTCDRSAAAQIDWDNVGVQGLKTLCNYTAHVGGLNN